MKLLKSFGTFSVIEILVLLSFVVYILFPISTPSALRPYVDSPLGYISMFLITIALFMYTSPLLGIMYIFVAYELIRRSAQYTPIHEGRATNKYSTQYMPTHVPRAIVSQMEKDSELSELNPPRSSTLEEEIVQMRAPIGRSDPVKYTESSFKPVADNLMGASMF